jgi:hypothetical protein
MGCNYIPNKEQSNTSRPAEEVAKEIVKTRSRPSYGATCDPDQLIERITAAIEAERKRLKDAEKWMRHLDGCALGSRIAYNSITKSFCTCGLDDFRKEK